MTRYTSIGRKRTYLEAGVSSSKESADGVENESANDFKHVDQVEPENHPPPAKRQRRAKVKRLKDGNRSSARTRVDAGSAEVVLGSERKEEIDVEHAEVKKAYKNRDEKRKMEAARSSRSEQRRLKRKQEKSANTTCFACREKGHAARDCPKVQPVTGDISGKGPTTSNNKTICYRCGSLKHTLSRCKKPVNADNPLPYASCYVCSGKGHIASSCPQNKEKGVYPNGGYCKLCGETSHLSRNCPTRKQVQESSALLVGTGNNAGADEDDFLSLKRVDAEIDLGEQRERQEAKAKKRKQNLTTTNSVLPLKNDNAVRISPTLVRKKVIVF